MKHIMRLPGGDDIPISVDEVRETHFSLTGRQALALLRILERHRLQLERQAKAEREAEFGRGPDYVAEIPKKIKRGNPRIGKRAVSLSNNYERRYPKLPQTWTKPHFVFGSWFSQGRFTSHC